jgi:alkanesulfonate monooxygenase SsuD/methylene tetrahydromethanopterin reductase-like flavin-dependent oxidoreductase (luciferase family)
MPIERRTLLQIISAGAVAPQALIGAATHCSSSGAGTEYQGYTFQYFTPEEQALAGRLMELIIPADSHSPGALAARVPAFADMMLSRGPERARAEWRAGLAAFTSGSPEELLAKAAEEEEAPRTDLGRFFVTLKRMTVDGYYTSKTGIADELKYEGNQHLMAAPQCTHPEHM